MSYHASNGGVSVLAFALIMAMSTGACSRGHSAKLLPPAMTPHKRVAKTETDKSYYRTQGGTPIAPVIIEDDSVAALPTVQAPASGGGPQGPRPTLNGDPNGLTRETLNVAIQGAMGSIASCFSSLTQDPMVAVSFEADPSGRPSLVRVSGAPTDAEHCIRNIIQGVRFPPFQGKGVQVDLPLSFHRVAQSQPSGNATGQQPAPGPSLFLEP
jgi:hypothetical protein